MKKVYVISKPLLIGDVFMATLEESVFYTTRFKATKVAKKKGLSEFCVKALLVQK